MNTTAYMPTIAHSTRSFAQALKKAGLTPPSSRKGSAGYRHQAGELFLDLLLAGIEWNGVGSGAWYCWPLDGAPEGHEPL